MSFFELLLGNAPTSLDLSQFDSILEGVDFSQMEFSLDIHQIPMSWVQCAISIGQPPSVMKDRGLTFQLNTIGVQFVSGIPSDPLGTAIASVEQIFLRYALLGLSLYFDWNLKRREDVWLALELKAASLVLSCAEQDGLPYDRHPVHVIVLPQTPQSDEILSALAEKNAFRSPCPAADFLTCSVDSIWHSIEMFSAVLNIHRFVVTDGKKVLLGGFSKAYDRAFISVPLDAMGITPTITECIIAWTRLPASSFEMWMFQTASATSSDFSVSDGLSFFTASSEPLPSSGETNAAMPDDNSDSNSAIDEVEGMVQLSGSQESLALTEPEDDANGSSSSTLKQFKQPRKLNQTDTLLEEDFKRALLPRRGYRCPSASTNFPTITSLKREDTILAIERREEHEKYPGLFSFTTESSPSQFLPFFQNDPIPEVKLMEKALLNEMHVRSLWAAARRRGAGIPPLPHTGDILTMYLSKVDPNDQTSGSFVLHIPGSWPASFTA